MNSSIIVALTVFLLTISVRVFAFPGEVVTMTRKPVSLSYQLRLHLLSCLMYASWVVYGYVQKDFIIMIAQGTGLMTSGIFTGHIVFRYWRS